MILESILPQHIDSTMMTCYRACKRKFYHEFILGLRPAATSIDLHAGGCFATAMERFQRLVHEKRLPVADALKETTIAFIQDWGDVITPDKSPKTIDNMILALHQYVATFPPGTDHVQPYRTVDGETTYEFSAAVPLDFPGFPLHPVTGEPYIYCGRFDLLGSYMGKPCVRDEKTGKAAGDKWAEQWDLRAQFMGYCWLGQMSGIEELETVIVRGVIVQKTNPRILEAMKIYPAYMIQRWFEQLRRDLITLTQNWNDSYFDFNFGDSCTAYGRCPFTSLCTASEPENWMNDYIVKRWNPLQHNPIAEKKNA